MKCDTAFHCDICGTLSSGYTPRDLAEAKNIQVTIMGGNFRSVVASIPVDLLPVGYDVCITCINTLKNKLQSAFERLFAGPEK